MRLSEVLAARRSQVVDGADIVAQGASAKRRLAARLRGVFDPRDFGAFGDGTSHTVQQTLGITTLAALANYTANGIEPYEWVAQYPFGTLFNLGLGAAAPAGSNILFFGGTAVVGSLIPVRPGAVSGATSVTITDRSLTADNTLVTAGTPISGVGIAPGTTVTNVTGFRGAWTLALSTPITADIPSGAFVALGIQPSAGKWSLPITSMTGIQQGDLVTGSGIATATQVEDANPSRLELWLSKATSAQMAAGQVLTFRPSWLARVRVGMQVQGSGIAPGTTVAAVDAAAGTVTLSTPTTADMAARTAITGVASPVQRSNTITFYAPFTDAEAAALEMDGLGIQAAERAAEAAGGGAVKMLPGEYRTSHPIVFPTTSSGSGYAINMVSLTGDAHNRNAVHIRPVRDFGPGNAALSCGDPTAKLDNARGLYIGEGQFSMGQWANFELSPVGSVRANPGLRPTIAGVPVAMDGLKHGPRRDMKDVLIQHFNAGILSVMDHTHLQNVVSNRCFDGLRMDQQQVNLFGDNVLDRLYLPGNGRAGLAIDANAYLNGIVIKPYWAYTPFAVLLEPRVGIGQGMQGVTITNPNLEGCGVGVIKDGGVRDGFFAPGASRTINDVKIVAPFFGPVLDSAPKSGQEWAGYIDVFGAYGLDIEEIYANTFGTIPGGEVPIIRVERVDASNTVGRGGVRLKGNGVWGLLQLSVNFAAQIVNGGGGLGSTFVSTGGHNYVTLEGADWKARLLPISDEGLTSVPNGTLLEYGTTTIAGGTQITVQRAGLGTGRPIAGVSIQPWGTNPTSRFLTAVAVSGSRLPIKTTAAAGVGSLLKTSTTTPGSAEAATGMADGGFVGMVSTPIDAASAYVKLMQAGGS